MRELLPGRKIQSPSPHDLKKYAPMLEYVDLPTYKERGFIKWKWGRGIPTIRSEAFNDLLSKPIIQSWRIWWYERGFDRYHTGPEADQEYKGLGIVFFGSTVLNLIDTDSKFSDENGFPTRHLPSPKLSWWSIAAVLNRMRKGSGLSLPVCSSMMIQMVEGLGQGWRFRLWQMKVSLRLDGRRIFSKSRMYSWTTRGKTFNSCQDDRKVYRDVSWQSLYLAGSRTRSWDWWLESISIPMIVLLWPSCWK